jgi:hypothetical protein
MVLLLPGFGGMTTMAKTLHVVYIESCAAFADGHDVIEVDAACMMACLADRIAHQDISSPLPVPISIIDLSAWSWCLWYPSG